MDEDKRKALEAAGWAFGDAEDFLELTPDERAEVERRIAAGDLIDPPPEVVATFGPASPENMIRITPTRPAVIPANTLKEGQVIRVTASSGNVFADLGCSEPERELEIAEAYAAWLRQVGTRHRTDLDGFRAGFLAAREAHHDARVKESAARMSEIHRETICRLAEDD